MNNVWKLFVSLFLILAGNLSAKETVTVEYYLSNGEGFGHFAQWTTKKASKWVNYIYMGVDGRVFTNRSSIKELSSVPAGCYTIIADRSEITERALHGSCADKRTLRAKIESWNQTHPASPRTFTTTHTTLGKKVTQSGRANVTDPTPTQSSTSVTENQTDNGTVNKDKKVAEKQSVKSDPGNKGKDKGREIDQKSLKRFDAAKRHQIFVILEVIAIATAVILFLIFISLHPGTLTNIAWRFEKVLQTGRLAITKRVGSQERPIHQQFLDVFELELMECLRRHNGTVNQNGPQRSGFFFCRFPDQLEAISFSREVQTKWSQIAPKCPHMEVYFIDDFRIVPGNGVTIKCTKTFQKRYNRSA